SILFAAVLVTPRAVMLYALELAWATRRFGARRRASGSVVAPDRRMSSDVMMNTDAGASARRSGRLDTDVIWRLASCSSDSSASSRVVGTVDWPWAPLARKRNAIAA